MSCANPSNLPNVTDFRSTRSTSLSTTPLRIAIIAHCLYPIAQPYAGGLEMITELLCNELGVTRP